MYVAPSLHVGLATGGPGAGPGLRVRLGPERRTHFEIGGVAPAAASGRPIGSHAYMQHAVWPIERLRITTGFGWEAHPEGRDAAVRVFSGLALDVNDLVSVELRGGWGGRSVNPVRMGPSAELRLTFRWDTGVWAEASEWVE